MQMNTLLLNWHWHWAGYHRTLMLCVLDCLWLGTLQSVICMQNNPHFSSLQGRWSCHASCGYTRGLAKSPEGVIRTCALRWMTNWRAYAIIQKLGFFSFFFQAGHKWQILANCRSFLQKCLCKHLIALRYTVCGPRCRAQKAIIG